MAVDIKSYRVFIASPGGLEQERRAFRDTLRDYNEMDAWQRGVVFWPVGWEDTLAGIGRPQSIINEEICSCDFFVMILWDRWGSSPDAGGQGEYTSGTEEEYHLALECRKEPRRPMQDIIVFFKALDQRQLSDPGSQLQRVLDFRRGLEQSKTLLFHTYDEVGSFASVLRRHLARWVRAHEAGGLVHAGAPQMPPGLVPGGSEAPSKEAASADRVIKEGQLGEKINEAWRLADEGRLVDAETLFAQLVVRGMDADTLNAYGRFLRRIGRLGQAQVMHEQALEISRQRGTREGMADSYSNLGLIYRVRGELGKAEEMHKSSLALEEALGRREGMAKQYGNLGLIYRVRGDLAEAEEMFKKSLALNEALGRQEGMAKQYGNLGLIYRVRGALAEAEEMAKKSLALDEALGHQEGMAKQYGNLGLIYQVRGDLGQAEEMFKKSLALNEALGRKEGMAISYSNLGSVYQARGQLDQAEEMHKESLLLNDALGRRQGVATQYEHLGLVYQTRQEFDQAEDMYKKALALSETIGFKEGVANSCVDLGAIHQARGDPETARRFWERALVLFQEAGMPTEVQKVRESLEKLGALAPAQG